jgi:glycopeptide antibiotics resistance protein
VSRLTRPALVLLVVYSALLLIAVLSPSSHDQSHAVFWLGYRLQDLGMRAATFTRLEVVMNAVIVAPVTFLASFVWPRHSWRDWAAFGFLVSLAVEAAQALLLPDRQASFSDVVANTAGALLGAVLARFIMRRCAVLANRKGGRASFRRR